MRCLHYSSLYTSIYIAYIYSCSIDRLDDTPITPFMQSHFDDLLITIILYYI
jgi:hypothetical protein